MKSTTKMKKKLKKIFLDPRRIASKSPKIHFETNLLQKDLFNNNKNLNVLLLINQSYKNFNLRPKRSMWDKYFLFYGH